MEILLLANFFALLDGLLYSFSILVKDYRKLIFVHIFSASCGLVCNLLLNAHSGIVLGIIGICYNLYRYFVTETQTDIFFYMFVLLKITMVLIFNDVGIIGILPLIASVSYMVVAYYTRSSTIMSIMMIVNASLWLPYSFYFEVYSSVVFTILTIILGLNRLLFKKKVT